MTIRIVTDSTCDLPQEIIQQYKITVIPLFINIGSKEFQDGIDLSRQEFYKKLPGFKPMPTTSTPGLDIFKQAYEKLAREGATEILSIHISVNLSATIDIAHKAAVETAVVPVTAFDSRQLSLGTGFEVLTAAQAAAEGRSIKEILAMLDEQIMRTYVFAALDTLEFLRRSGRMNVAVSALGTILQIKPLLKMYDGNPTSERVRTRKGAHKRLLELFNEHRPYERVALLHSNAADQAQSLLQEIKGALPIGEVWIEEINPVLGVHIGPGVIGFACISKNIERKII
jgi:DegV family protein with EDD domain